MKKELDNLGQQAFNNEEFAKAATGGSGVIAAIIAIAFVLLVAYKFGVLITWIFS